MILFDYLYQIFLGICAIFGLHRLILAVSVLKKPFQDPPILKRWKDLPFVTVQLPIFNESRVVERLLAAVAALDYPKDRFEIQILDDSTDETTLIAARKMEELKGEGFICSMIHRDNRTGYKAGALENGTKYALGEYIAVFDADFVPTPDFIRTLIHYFTDPRIGMVQMRWGHLNQHESFLTRLQSALIDSHFAVDQSARFINGRYFGFNGSGGVWRKSAIHQAGDWQGDTLAEDMDLSYRAQMAGAKFLLLMRPQVPQELPNDMNAFKQQQFRWSKGSFEVGRKLLSVIWKSRMSLANKVEATFHMGANIAYTFMAVSALISLPSVLSGDTTHSLARVILESFSFFVCFTSTFLYYAIAQKRLYKDFGRRLLYFPFFLAAVAGLSIIHVHALWEAMRGIKTPFVRTPKRGDSPGANSRAAGPAAKVRMFAGRKGLWVGLEFLMSAYIIAAIILSFVEKEYGFLPFGVLMGTGFAYTFTRSALPELGAAMLNR